MIQIWLLLAAVTAALGAATYGIHSIKESGREECRAEHFEAARMAELRQRERGNIASQRFSADIAESRLREKETRRSVERTAGSGSCLSDDSLRELNDYIRKARDPGKPDATLREPAGHPGSVGAVSGSVDR